LKLTLGEIARKLKLELQGDPSISISGLAGLEEAGPEHLSFLFNTSYQSRMLTSKAAAVVLRKTDAIDCEVSVLISDNPRLAWANIAKLFDPKPLPNLKIHETAVISPSATCGSDVTIGPYAVVEAGARLDRGVIVGAGCFIGDHVEIGENSVLAANVSVYYQVKMGKNVIVHSGAVLGADGFGFEFDSNTAKLVKIPQIYSVTIGDDVEIGAGTTIDRGALKDTFISNGVKIDNQVQIGHGTSVGANTAISGCTAIAGSTSIGAYCLIGGGVGIVDNIQIVDQVEVTAMSLVSKSIREKGRYSSGTGLLPGKTWRRSIVGFAKLNDILKRIRALESSNKKLE
jgi:UDP-3-O-[3-hydroxymyristoyl] glucosamine N-acyltransferase